MFRRLLVAVPLGALTTIALFLLMRTLVAPTDEKFESVEGESISLTRKIRDEESRPRDRTLKPPDIREPTSQAPRPDREAVLRDIDVNTEIRTDGPTLPPGFTGEKPGLHSMDGDASPLVRGRPPFPACAKGPGEAVLEFFILPDGSVGPVKIVSATNSCFARAAVRAAQRWRYRPKVVDSKPVRSDLQRVKLIFIPEEGS